MHLPSVRSGVFWSALMIAASGTLSCTAAALDPLGTPPPTTATPRATGTPNIAAATASPTAVASHTPSATATSLAATAAVEATPSPLDEGIARFTDACTNANVEVNAEPRVIVERVALATDGVRVTARLELSPLVLSTTQYTGDETVPTVAELRPGEVVQKEISVSLTAGGGHVLTLTYTLTISSEAATAALSQVSGHCR